MMTLEQLRTEASELARTMEASASGWTPEIRRNFVRLREEMLIRGIYDPVLIRYDSISAPRSDLPTLARQLAVVAGSLT